MLKWRSDCIRKRIESLTGEIRRVSAKHHASQTPQLIYEALLHVLSSIDSDVQRSQFLYAGSDDPFDARLFAASLTTSEEDVGAAVKLFRNCDRVDSSRIPFEILSSLTTTAQELLGAPCLVVLHLTSDYNYKIYSCRAWFEKAKWPNPWPSGTVSDILLLVFPSYEVASVSLHAAAAHELGHVVTAQFSKELADVVLPAVRSRHLESPDEKTLAVAERVIKVPGAGDILSATAWDDIQERLFTVPIQWVIETTADLIAVRLVGPAFMAALERITLAAADASDSHPPDRLRHRYIRDYVIAEMPLVAADAAWNQLLAPRYPEEDSTRQQSARIGGEDYIYKVARLVLQDCYPQLKELVRRVPSPLLEVGDTPKLRKRISQTKTQSQTVDDLLQHIEQSLFDLTPPSRGCDIVAPSDVARHFWLFFYGTWRLRMSPRFDDFRRAHGWSEGDPTIDQVIGSMLLHSLQSLSVSLTVRSRTTTPPPSRRSANAG